jgi:hypothetical protein
MSMSRNTNPTNASRKPLRVALLRRQAKSFDFDLDRDAVKGPGGG